MGRWLWLAAMAAAMGTAASYDNGSPNGRMPPLGWSSWEGLGAGADHPVRDYCDANSVMAAADAYIETGLYAAGYRHLHLDDCWSIAARDGAGTIQWDPARFPDGMAPVIDYVHKKNLTFGLYTSGGSHACMASRAGSKGHWVEDASSFASWGVDWVKMDWCGGSDVLDSYGNMSAALNTTGRPMGFNMCEWGESAVWTWGDRVAQSWRISPDHAGTWTSTVSAIAAAAKIPPSDSGRPYGWNDMDMLQTGNGPQSGYDPHFAPPNMTLTESITEFSMWAIFGSPMLVTTPIMNCTAQEASAFYAAKRARVAASSAPCTVSLTKQMSEANCSDGVTYGCLGTTGDKKMWVRGCRGVFVCDGVSNVVCNEECKTYPAKPCNFTCSCSSGPAPPPPCAVYTNATACDAAGARCHWNPPDGTPAGGKCTPAPKPGPPPPTPANPPKHCVPMLNDVQKTILLNTEAIAVSQDVTRGGRPLVGHDIHVWTRNHSDGSISVALYNPDDGSALIGVPSFEAFGVGWGPSTKVSVRDIWANTSDVAVGSITNRTVPPHGTVLLRLTSSSSARGF